MNVIVWFVKREEDVTANTKKELVGMMEEFLKEQRSPVAGTGSGSGAGSVSGHSNMPSMNPSIQQHASIQSDDTLSQNHGNISPKSIQTTVELNRFASTNTAMSDIPESVSAQTPQNKVTINQLAAQQAMKNNQKNSNVNNKNNNNNANNNMGGFDDFWGFDNKENHVDFSNFDEPIAGAVSKTGGNLKQITNKNKSGKEDSSFLELFGFVYFLFFCVCFLCVFEFVFCVSLLGMGCLIGL